MKELKIPKYLLDYINANPALISLLYDLDLLPEQTENNTTTKVMMIVVCAGFRAGADSKNLLRP